MDDKGAEETGHGLLASTMPEARIAPYSHAVSGTTVEPLALYRWNSRVALALFDDIATVEVAMRSAMARELHAAFGAEWFRRGDLFDDETLRLIETAWRQGKLASLKAPPETVEGKLIASLMFGFWVKLLGRGSTVGGGSDTVKRVYDDLLWKPALRAAFPNVGDLERKRVQRSANDIQTVRNRIAHHEHVIWGSPVPGQRESNGRARRISVGEAHETLRSVAGYIDDDLRAWLTQHSSVPDAFAACPLEDRSRFETPFPS